MTGLEVWLETLNVGPATVDPVASYYDGAGTLSLTPEGQLAVDMRGTSYIHTSAGARFTFPVEISFAGAVSAAEGAPRLSFTSTCPQEGATREFDYTATPTTLTLYLSFRDPAPGVQVMTFSAPRP
jgi:hypothetical protein